MRTNSAELLEWCAKEKLTAVQQNESSSTLEVLSHWFTADLYR